MLIGQYEHTIDNKKRLALPSKFRGELGEKVIITKGVENCLIIYTEKELSWNNTDKKFKASLDRIDSSKGHIKGNCQLVILPMNYLKGNKTEDEFKKLINCLKNPNIINESDAVEITDKVISKKFTGIKI